MIVRRIYRIVGAAALCGGLMGLLTAAAQDAPPLLATNTPQPSAPLFATNTPQPGMILPVVARPDAPLDFYALRLWTEADLVGVLLSQTRQLQPDDQERQLAIRLLQYELQRRFPGAPRSADLRRQLLDAMLAAPRGSVDMRRPVRAFIEEALNELRPTFEGVTSLDVGGFNLTITPANVDGQPATRDAVLHTRYPSVGEAIYEDYIVAQLDAQGVYRVLESQPSLPAAPLGNVTAISLERLGDANSDGVDELSLAVDTGGINRELMIFGWRSGGLVSLVAPGERILFGSIVSWPLQSDTLTARVYQVESAAWGCLGERDVPWAWRLNYFRPAAQVDNFTFQNRLACLLYGAEPLFEQPVAEAIGTVEAILQFAQADDQASAQRAAMVVAMLYLLDGREDIARQQAEALRNAAAPASWLAGQTAVFLNALAQPGTTPVQVCAALEASSQYGACDVEQVLTRLFDEQPLRRDEPIEAQLAALGISVLDKQTISAVGRRDRQAFRFNLAGDRWWAFAPLQADVYTAEKIEPPPGYTPPVVTPLPVATPPESAYSALLVEGSPAAALNILDNALRDNPGGTLASSARFLQALCYDLLADRTNARRAYFALWSDDPASVWGQMAAAHLERR